MRHFQVCFRIDEEITRAKADQRRRLRQPKSRRVVAALNKWLMAQRQLVPNGSANAKVIDYSLKRWQALTQLCSYCVTVRTSSYRGTRNRPVGNTR